MPKPRALSNRALNAIILGLTLIALSSSGPREGKIAQVQIQSPAGSHAPKTAPDFGNIPLYFIPNQGQVDPRALFYVKTSAYTLWMTRQSLIFDSWRREGQPAEKSNDRQGSGHRNQREFGGTSERDVTELALIGANPNAEVSASGPTDHRVNYIIGDDPSRWMTGLRTSRAVLYKDIFPEIDLSVHGLEKQVEVDWLIHPRGKVDAIRFAYKNAQNIELDHRGQLVVATRFGPITHKKPRGFQTIDGQRNSIPVEFKRLETNAFGFEVGPYDDAYPLVIDPEIIVSSTYLGGNGNDLSQCIKVDSSGSVFVAGYTDSTNFPTTAGAVRPAYGGVSDAFIVKFAPAGRSLIFSTYLGGSGGELLQDMEIDGGGSVYVCGETWSSDFPRQSALDTTLGGVTDAFVTKLSAAGNSLLYSTYLGGTSYDGANGIAVDGSGAAYITGITQSSNFPVTNAYDASYSGGGMFGDAFVVKLSVLGTSLIYATYLGGIYDEMSSKIAVDGTGAAYVVGYTFSPDFPRVNAFDSSFGGSGEGFVTKFTPTGTTLAYSTLLGGSEGDSCRDIVVDESGAAYILGMTSSADFPVSNAFDSLYNGGGDGFLVKLKPAGNGVDYSTFFGGSGLEYTYALVRDGNGAIYAVGDTTSADFPLKDPYDATLSGFSDVFIFQLDAAGRNLVFSTFFGGIGSETGYDVDIDSQGALYLTGRTNSANFPIQNAYDSSYNGGYNDGFVAKLLALFPPLNFQVQRVENNFIFFKEHVNRLTWELNPGNKMTITTCRIYRKVQGSRDIPYELLAEIDGTAVHYDDRGLSRDSLYIYRVTLVDEFGRESDSAVAQN